MKKPHPQSVERMVNVVAAGQRELSPAEQKRLGVQPTGQAYFDAMTTEEQDALLGPEKAQMVRDGEVELSDLVQRSHQDEGRVFIQPKPLEDL